MTSGVQGGRVFWSSLCLSPSLGEAAAITTTLFPADSGGRAVSLRGPKPQAPPESQVPSCTVLVPSPTQPDLPGTQMWSRAAESPVSHTHCDVPVFGEGPGAPWMIQRKGEPRPGLGH